MIAVTAMKACQVAVRIWCVLAAFCICTPALSQTGAARQDAPKSQAAEPPNQTELGRKAYQRGDLIGAEKLLLAAGTDSEKNGEERNLELAGILRDLGLVYSALGKPDEAEPALRRSLKIRIGTLS